MDIQRAIKKARKSSSRFKIAAVGVGKNLIVYKSNSHRFLKKGGSLHAEMAVMQRYHVKTIFLFRVGARGDLRPIHPCKACASKAKELGVTIIGVW